jgi:tRNA (guanine37-N1)-methyltransferase
MQYHILSIFPNILDSYLNESILKRAQANGIIKIYKHDLRDWTSDKHKTVDDTPYGGGAGMVMKVDVLHKALCAIESRIMNHESGIEDKSINHDSEFMIHDSKIILLSAKGKKWNQKLAREYAKLDNIIFVCGRYEGVDERITKFIDEEISIGDFVLTGGELGAAIIIDSITRLLPGALGNADSAVSESHTTEGMLEYPQYTRPEVFEVLGKKYKVPKILLGGNHAEIEIWRKSKMKKRRK